MTVRIRNAILLFGIVNASLYSALLPLWEGFDEAFHYAYVETLWQTKRLPVLGRTLVPDDVAASFRLAPVSHVIHRWTPEATPYDAWFALTEAEKAKRRGDLETLRPTLETSMRPNYEAHQPPLAYVLLALLDAPLSGVSITARVLVLRLAAAISAVVLVFFGASALCRTLEIPQPFAAAALFAIFCSQMLYATTAHVANDWLAVGISAMLLAALAQCAKKPDLRTALASAIWLAAGLLTKAYFLGFVLLAAAVSAIALYRRHIDWKTVLLCAALVLVVAGPWYARNLALYGSVSGTHEEFDGIGVRQALAAAPKIDWPATTGFLARASLWTGNNSFTSYSRTTLHLMLALLAAGMVGWAALRREIQAAEWVVFSAIILFSAAVAYASCASFAHRNGDVPGASPWYTQVLLVPVFALVFLGMSRSGRFGLVLASLTTLVSTWLLLATWIVKLFPMYSGAGSAPMRMRAAWEWYVDGAATHAGDLSLTALAPASLLYAGLLVAVLLTVGLSVCVIRAPARSPTPTIRRASS